jgi:general secretion pathway protein F
VTLFRYKAVTPEGLTVQGEMEAPTQLAVVERLQAQGQLPLTAEADEKPARGGGWLGRSRPSPGTLAIMTREIATLLEAGLPLDRAMEMARDVAESAAVAQILDRVLVRVRGGASFSKALSEEGEFFPRLYVSTIQAGEAGAALGAVMRRLSVALERTAALRETVRSALIYPAILGVVVTGSIVVLLTVVVPQFKPIFEEAGRNLPTPTRVIVALGDMVTDWGWLIGGAILAVIALARQAWRRSAVRRPVDRALLRIWLVGGLIARFDTARFCRTLGTLTENGVQLVAALDIAGETIGNTAIRDAVSAVLPQVRSGLGLAEAMRGTGRFPVLAVQLMRVGEETGRPSEMLLKTAEIFEGEVQRYTERLLALLVPALTVGLGLIVAGIVASMLLAVLSVNDLAF